MEVKRQRLRSEGVPGKYGIKQIGLCNKSIGVNVVVFHSYFGKENDKQSII